MNKKDKKIKKEKIENHVDKIKDVPEELQDALKNADIFNNPDASQENNEIEDIKAIIETWLDKRFVHAKTRLTPNQVIALTILKTLATKYNIKCIDELLENYVTYKLSENGQSSKELVDILKSRNQEIDDTDLNKQLAPFLR